MTDTAPSTDAQAAEFAAFKAWQAEHATDPVVPDAPTHTADPVDVLLQSLRLDLTPAHRDTVVAWCESQGYDSPELPKPPEPDVPVQPNYGQPPAAPVSAEAAPVAASPAAAAVDPNTGLPSLAGAPPVVDPTTGEPV